MVNVPQIFTDLFKLEKVRTWKEAIGFYLAYFALLLVLLALLGFLIAGDNFQKGFNLGVVVAVLFCIALSFATLYRKKKLQNFGLVLVALLSGVAAIYAGGLLGLIPVAYLTTISARE